ncbi:MAG TPA: lysylphosphatidylglycerol synthase transmembrane domain-containing protein [Chitinivibrionales bacterium]|nr:lysylphosphatidylglycerol synthase transmembrane domain-containing protein [Chitinivibrionales bacterium]
MGGLALVLSMVYIDNEHNRTFIIQKIHILSAQSFFKNFLLLPLRFLVAIVPIAWIFLSIKWNQMAHTVASIAWWTVPLLFVVIVSSMFLQGIRWWILLRTFDRGLTIAKTLRAHFVGLYFSIVLPSSGAQNVVRAMLLSKEAGYSLSWGSSWVASIIGLFALAFMSVFGLVCIDRSTLPKGFFESIVSAFCVLIVLFYLSFSKRATGPMRKLLYKIIPLRFLKALENIREAIYRYRAARGYLLVVVLVTLFMQVTITAGACFVIYGISRKFILFECLLYLPIIEILCISIPLTPNGLGIREGLLALMFSQVGLTKEQLGIYIVLGFFSISLKLLGGIPLLLGGGKEVKDIKNRLLFQAELPKTGNTKC